jgi:hypothetical protein
MAMWHINRKDLSDFLRTYPQEIRRNCDIIQIIDIAAGLKIA